MVEAKQRRTILTLMVHGSNDIKRMILDAQWGMKRKTDGKD
jgi:hypothetical protein